MSSDDMEYGFSQESGFSLLFILSCHGFIQEEVKVQIINSEDLEVKLVGTVPAMSFAPGIIRKFLRPIALRMPKISSILLISLGLFTITQRAYSLYVYNTCH